MPALPGPLTRRGAVDLTWPREGTMRAPSRQPRSRPTGANRRNPQRVAHFGPVRSFPSQADSLPETSRRSSARRAAPGGGERKASLSKRGKRAATRRLSSRERRSLCDLMLFAACIHASASAELEAPASMHTKKCERGAWRDSRRDPKCVRCAWIGRQSKSLDEFIAARAALRRVR